MTEYEIEIAREVYSDLSKAIRILNNLNHNFGLSTELDHYYEVVCGCKQILSSVVEELYQISIK